MSVEENKAIARRWNEEIISKKRFEAFDEVLHSNYANRSGWSDSSWAPAMQGREQAKQRFQQGLQEHPTWRVSVDDVIGEGDKVAVRMTFFEEEKAVANAIAIYRFSDGKIVDDWACIRQFGQSQQA
jgi:predicted SnoaL-like aldol condensation-catalyzing enzyme